MGSSQKTKLYNDLADLFPSGAIDAQCLVEIVEDLSIRNILVLHAAIKRGYEEAFNRGIDEGSNPNFDSQDD